MLTRTEGREEWDRNKNRNYKSRCDGDKVPFRNGCRPSRGLGWFSSGLASLTVPANPAPRVLPHYSAHHNNVLKTKEALLKTGASLNPIDTYLESIYLSGCQGPKILLPCSIKYVEVRLECRCYMVYGCAAGGCGSLCFLSKRRAVRELWERRRIVEYRRRLFL